MMQVAIGIDPGQRSGVAAWQVRGHLRSAQLVNIGAASWSEAAGVDLLDHMIGESEWLAAIEKPWGHLRGHQSKTTAPPTYAAKFWKNVLVLLARKRAKRLGLAYRRPLILEPRPNEWRAGTGVPVRCPGVAEAERTANLKASAIRILKSGYDVEIEQPDVAEATLISIWAASKASFGVILSGPRRMPKKVNFAA